MLSSRRLRTTSLPVPLSEGCYLILQCKTRQVHIQYVILLVACFRYAIFVVIFGFSAFLSDVVRKPCLTLRKERFSSLLIFRPVRLGLSPWIDCILPDVSECKTSLCTIVIRQIFFRWVAASQFAVMFFVQTIIESNKDTYNDANQ